MDDTKQKPPVPEVTPQQAPEVHAAPPMPHVQEPPPPPVPAGRRREEKP